VRRGRRRRRRRGGEGEEEEVVVVEEEGHGRDAERGRETEKRVRRGVPLIDGKC